MDCFYGLSEGYDFYGTQTVTDYQSICVNTTESVATFRVLSPEESSSIFSKFAPINDLNQLWILITAGFIFCTSILYVFIIYDRKEPFYKTYLYN